MTKSFMLLIIDMLMCGEKIANLKETQIISTCYDHKYILHFEAIASTFWSIRVKSYIDY